MLRECPGHTSAWALCLTIFTSSRSSGLASAGRWRATSAHAAYRMPLFPLVIVLSLLGLGYVFYESWGDPDAGRLSLYANFAVIALSLGYYLVVLRARGGWVLRGPEEEPRS